MVRLFLCLLFLTDLLNVRTFQFGNAIVGFCPLHCVLDHVLYILIMIDGEGLMTGLEVEDLAVFAVEGHTGAEHLAALIPGDEHNIIGIGNAERLTVGLVMGQLKITAQTLCDRMRRLYDPDTLHIAVLAPVQVAGGTHQEAERLGMMTGMQEDNTHTLLHRISYTECNLIGNLMVRSMTPYAMLVSSWISAME